VRGCWIVSFFFTPIYMFILVFVVVFGPKKGVLSTFKSVWDFQYYNSVGLLVNAVNGLSSKFLSFSSMYRFQYTLFTSRPTIYVLFVFWSFFFFFGESLFSVLFNFSTLTDAVPANFFFLLKTHTVFFLSANSTYINNTIMFYIVFFTVCSFLFLLNLRYTFNYFYINNLWIYELIFLLVLLYIFLNFYLLLFLLFSALLALINKKLLLSL
jgi:hypothetical protein